MAAWIYVGSRAAWISVICGSIVMIYSTRRFRKTSYLIRKFIFFLFMGLVGYWILVLFVGELESYRRFIFLFDPQSIPELNSYEVRGSLILEGLKLALEMPIFGVGLTNVKMKLGLWPHNDYVAILGDMGIVGLGLFLSLLGMLLARVWSIDSRGNRGIPYTSLGKQGALVSTLVFLFFSDTYTIVPFWILLGFCWSTNVVKNRQEV